MICKINNKHIQIKSIGPPTMNYGQSWRYKHLKKVSYEFNMPISEFVKKTGNWFDNYQTESISDSKIELKGEYPLQDKYKDNSFPDLNQMLKNHQKLLAEIIMFFDLDLLNLLDSSYFAPGLNKYIINSLDWVKIESIISMGGEAFLINKSK